MHIHTFCDTPSVLRTPLRRMSPRKRGHQRPPFTLSPAPYRPRPQQMLYIYAFCDAPEAIDFVDSLSRGIPPRQSPVIAMASLTFCVATVSG